MAARKKNTDAQAPAEGEVAETPIAEAEVVEHESEAVELDEAPAEVVVDEVVAVVDAAPVAAVVSPPEDVALVIPSIPTGGDEPVKEYDLGRVIDVAGGEGVAAPQAVTEVQNQSGVKVHPPSVAAGVNHVPTTGADHAPAHLV